MRDDPHAWEDPVRDATRAAAASGVNAEQIPAGMWLRPTTDDAVPAASVPADPVLVERACTMPATPDGPRLLLGTPGREPVPAAAVATLLAALPSAVRRRTEVVLYDSNPAAAAAVAAVAADLGEPVLAGIGLPTVHGAGQGSRRWVAADGTPTWKPYAQLVQFPPDRLAPRVVRAEPPVHGWPAGPAVTSWTLVPGWQVATVPSGLWIRHALASRIGSPATAGLPRSDRLDIFVGEPDLPIPRELLPAVAALLHRLPTPARQLAQVVVPAAAEAAAAADLPQWRVVTFEALG